MGFNVFDQYTYLHFAVGIVVYFWGVSLPAWVIFHSLYEIFEITPMGIEFINKIF